jgi:hypothetical protein
VRVSIWRDCAVWDADRRPAYRFAAISAFQEARLITPETRMPARFCQARTALSVDWA